MFCTTVSWTRTGFGEGEPFFATRRPWMLADTLALRFLPSESALRSTLAMPLIPASGATTPLEARSRWEIATCALSGVAGGVCLFVGGGGLVWAGEAPSGC